MLKIIVVEDDPEDYFLLEESVRKSELCVLTHFADPQDFWVYLNCLPDRELPDLIISDLKMPKLTGLELLRLIKAAPGFSALKMIIYSTSNRQEDIDACLMAGAADYLQKPFHADGYKQLVERICSIAAV
jgi:CheY-like chemotaxis protein